MASRSAPTRSITSVCPACSGQAPGRAKGTRDPRTDHPVIQAVRAATGRYPPKTIYDKIIREINDNINLRRMRDSFECWCARGYKPTNYA